MLIPSKFSGYARDGRRVYPGGKGNSAPPPDPAYTAAAARNLDAGTAMYNKIMANSDEMMPLQKQQLQFGLSTARTAWDQSQQDRSWALGQRAKLTQAQDNLSNQAAAYNSGQMGDKYAGQAVADTGQMFDAQRGEMARGLQRMGVDPASGRALAMQADTNMGEAAAKANAANKMRDAARQEGFTLQSNAISALSGAPQTAMSATGAGAGYGGSGLGYANSALAGMNSGYATAGQGLTQVGNGYSNLYGTMGNVWNTANQNDPFNTILGAVSGGAGAYGMKMLLA